MGYQSKGLLLPCGTQTDVALGLTDAAYIGFTLRMTNQIEGFHQYNQQKTSLK